jgi:hypothetical protein
MNMPDRLDKYAGLLELAYLESGNPLQVWATYRLYRLAAEQPPEWVLQYFDRAAANLMAVPKQVKNPSTAIAEAMEMKVTGKSGRGTAFSDNIGGRMDYAFDTWSLVLDGTKETYAIETTANKFGVSPSTVRSAYHRLKGALEKSRTLQNQKS